MPPAGAGPPGKAGAEPPASLIPALFHGGAMAGPTPCRQCGRSFEPYGGHYRVYCKDCTAKADSAIVMEPRAKCKECGKALATTSRSVRYCSDECRTESVRRGSRDYQRRAMADPERRAIILARVRASAAASAARKRGGRPPQRRQRPPVRTDTSAEPSTCRLCGRTFATYGRANHAYCKRCTAKADRAIAKRPHTDCKECGKALAATSHSVRYCSDACRADGARRIRRESTQRRMADPEKRAINAAYMRAWHAARAGRKSGR